MTKKQSNPKPKNIKRPTPPPAPPRPYSDPAVEDMIEGLDDMAESIRKKNEGRMINPKDYLRTVTEGTVKPDRSFIWTEDSMVEAAGRPTKTPLRKLKEGQITKPEEPPVRIVQEGVKPEKSKYIIMQGGVEIKLEQIKKVYCEDCKHIDVYYLCSKVVGYDDNPLHKVNVYMDLEISNKNNNCQYYKEKWYKKLWRMFK